MPRRRWSDRALDVLERAGNRLPDPAMLFVVCLLVVWALSALLSPVAFELIDPRTHAPIRVHNQLTGQALTSFLVNMVAVFVGFPPLGVVLTALLGVGVAEHSGFMRTGLKVMLRVTPKALLTPALVLVGILSNVASDVGFVLVIPFGGLLFAAAGRHPLAGIAAAFAGVSAGFSANLLPASLDPLLQGITQAAVQLVAPERTVNPLCNWFFMAASSGLLTLLGWYLTDRVVEPRLAGTRADGGGGGSDELDAVTPAERRGLRAALWSILIGLALLFWAAFPKSSPLRGDDGSLTANTAPLMGAIVPLIFLLSLLPGVVFGYVAGTLKSHRDVIAGMSKTMATMGYYLVMAFCAAQFIAAFGHSNLGALVALQGAHVLKSLDLMPQVTVLGAVLLSALLNLLIGSSSALWLLLAPILVPMLAQVGVAPELTQAAYRIGDSATNVITPLMAYFPLVVVYCQRYVKSTGIGTLAAMMMPYSVTFLVAWYLFLVAYWQLGLPLGLQSSYTFP